MSLVDSRFIPAFSDRAGRLCYIRAMTSTCLYASYKARVIVAACLAVILLGGCGKTRPNDQFLSELDAGRAAYKKSDWATAQQNFARAARIAEKAPPTAETLGTATILKGVKVAAPALSQSIDIWTLALGPDHPTVLTGLFQMAYIYYLNGNYKLGDAALDRALKAYKHSGKQLPDGAEFWLSFIPQLLSSQGERNRAANAYLRILSTHTDVLGADSLVVNRYKIDRANFLALRRLYPEAIAEASEAVKIAQAKNFDAKTRAYTVKRLGWINAQAGKYETAEKLYKQCISILDKDKEQALRAEQDLCAFYEEYGGFDESARQREHIYSKLKAEGAKPEIVNGAAHELVSVWQDRFPDKAVRLAQVVIDDYDQSIGPASPEAAHMLHHLAFCQANLGNSEATRAACDWGMAVLAWDARGHVRAVINDLARFADRLSSVGKDEQAVQALDRALNLARESREQEEWGVQETPEALALKHKADWMRGHGTTAQAMKTYEQAIAAIRGGKRKDDPTVAQYSMYQTETALERGDYKSAEQAAAEAERIYIEWMGDKSARRARILSLRARAVAGLHDLAAAKKYEQQARTIVEAAGRDDPFDCCETWAELGQLCLDQKRDVEAQLCFQKILDLKTQFGTRGDTVQARAFDGQAMVALHQKRVKEALALSNRAMKSLDQVCFVTPHAIGIAVHNIDLAKRNDDKKTLEQAKALARRWALEIYGPNHATTKSVLQM